MRLICRKDVCERLLERLKDYQDIDITLIEKGMEYEGFGYIFTLENLDNLIYYLDRYKQSKVVMTGMINERLHFINVRDIYYIEGLSKEVYIYTLEKSYQSKLKLYEIEQQLNDLTFIRISKSIIVNLRQIDYLLPETNMRFAIYLKNGVKVILSRKYIKAFKEKVKMR